jgi:hypothetical protein
MRLAVVLFGGIERLGFGHRLFGGIVAAASKGKAERADDNS